MIKYPVFTLIIIFSMMACQSPKEKADLIIHNALVYTVDEKFSIQQAFAVKDGKFIAIGTDESILEKFEADSIIDMRGNPVYPGFIDAHCHFFGYGYNLLKRADLTGTTSFEEVVARLKDHNEKYHPNWLEGRGWD
ncbi:MAG: amidohydrolase family protein, partial [Candidatus Omnitrophica bacterium]|nr:amidohydrolase family protein [Candidatus Omnitrophota bacterium]